MAESKLPWWAHSGPLALIRKGAKAWGSPTIQDPINSIYKAATDQSIKNSIKSAKYKNYNNLSPNEEYSLWSDLSRKKKEEEGFLPPFLWQMGLEFSPTTHFNRAAKDIYDEKNPIGNLANAALTTSVPYSMAGKLAGPPIKNLWTRGSKYIKNLENSPSFRGALHPAMWKQGQYTKDQLGYMWDTLRGKPLGPLSAGSNAIDGKGPFPFSKFLLDESPFAKQRNVSSKTHDLLYTSHDKNIIDQMDNIGIRRPVHLTDDPYMSAPYGSHALSLMIPKFDKRFDAGLAGIIGGGAKMNKVTQGARETIWQPQMFNDLLDEDLILNLGPSLRENIFKPKFKLNDLRDKAITEAYYKQLKAHKEIY